MYLSLFYIAIVKISFEFNTTKKILYLEELKGVFTHADFVGTDSRKKFGAESVFDPLLCLHCERNPPRTFHIGVCIELDLLRKMVKWVQNVIFWFYRAPWDTDTDNFLAYATLYLFFTFVFVSIIMYEMSLRQAPIPPLNCLCCCPTNSLRNRK